MKTDAHVVDLPTNVPSLASTEEEVRQLLMQYNRTRRNLPWKPKVPLDKIQIKSIRQLLTVSYSLHTMRERRQIITKREPSVLPIYVINQSPSSSSSSTSSEEQPRTDLTLWQIPVRKQPTPFVKDTVTEELPGTSLIVTCDDCSGSGRILCSQCNGNGLQVCWSCQGMKDDDETGRRVDCSVCLDEGKLKCGICDEGKVNCQECRGMKYIKETKWIEVKWTCWRNEPYVAHKICYKWAWISPVDFKNADEAATEQDIFFQNDCGRGERKDIVVEGGEPFLSQITNTSKKLTKDTFKEGDSTRVIRFREVLKVIPIVEVKLGHKRKEYKMFFVGNQGKVKWVGGFPEAFQSDACVVM